MNTNELLEKLVKDARRLRLGQPLPNGDLPWEAVQRVRSDFLKILKQPGVTIAQLAEAMGSGYSRGTLSRFKNIDSQVKRTGDLDRVVRGINRFLETIARRAEAPTPKEFVETHAAKKMLVLIAKTIELNCIGLIFSDASRGKTLTLRAAAAIHPGSILVRVMQSIRSPGGFAKHLAKSLNIRGADSMLKAQMLLIDKLQGTGRALMIDEAHQMRNETLEFLRDLHDECGVPIIMAGTLQINDRVNDQDLFFGQFSSRVGLRLDLTEALRDTPVGQGPKPLHTIAEIRTLYEADKVRLTDDGRELLAKIANLPGLGGLRLCSKIIQVASAAANGELITARLIRQVIRATHGRTHGIGQVERQIEQSRIAIA